MYVQHIIVGSVGNSIYIYMELKIFIMHGYLLSFCLFLVRPIKFLQASQYQLLLIFFLKLLCQLMTQR